MQLSPIQCTYSNIFIRFFKFFPANTNIYQNSYRVIGANCAVEIALSGRQCSLLCLFAPFSPRKYKSILRGLYNMVPFRGIATASPLAVPRNDIKCVARDNVKKVCRLCNYFSANKRLLCSVRSTLSLRAQRGNLPEGLPCHKPKNLIVFL